MTNPTPLQHGRVYHIYNRGINRENVFLEERNYRHFLKLYTQHVAPIVFTYAYCLLRNHFHLMVQIKTPEEIRNGENLTGLGDLSGLELASKPPGQVFSNFFNAYAKAINKAYGRTGALWQRPFGRIEVTSDQYFVQLITYIHHNPIKHGFVDHLGDWPYSSYMTFASTQPTRLERQMVLDWFNGPEGFAAAHAQPPVENKIEWVIGHDDD